MGQKLHFWVGNKTGYVFGTSETCPIRKPLDRLKYMGFTEDAGWPKKMNTGRLLHKPDGKTVRRQKKLRKQINN